MSVARAVAETTGKGEEESTSSATASSTQAPAVVTPRVPPIIEKSSTLAWHLFGADGLVYGRLFSMSPFARGQNSPVQQTYTVYNEHADCFTTYLGAIPDGHLSMSSLPVPQTKVLINSAWQVYSGYELVFESEDCSSQAWIDVSLRATKPYESGDGYRVDVQSNFCQMYGDLIFKIAEAPGPRKPLVPKSFIHFSDYVGPDTAVERRMPSNAPVRYTITTAKCQKVTSLNLEAVWKRFDDVTKLMPPSLPLLPVELKSM